MSDDPIAAPTRRVIHADCRECGKPIHVKPRNFLETGNFCSRSCHYSHGAGRERPNRRTGSILSCEVCDREFYICKARLARSRFCSRSCKGIGSRLKEVTCSQCGKVFKPKQSARKRKVCSRECSAKSRMTWSRADRKCESCGCMFQPKRKIARFCCKDCATVSQASGRTSHICIVCAKEFFWSPSRHKTNNIKYCSIKCRNLDPNTKKRLLRMNAMQSKAKINKNELRGYAILDSIGCEYLRQNLIGGKFCVDAFIPSHNIVVQFDGDYWHGNPDKFKDLDKRQSRRVALDKSQDLYMKACGISVLRFWDSVMSKNPQSVMDEIVNMISEKELSSHLIATARIEHARSQSNSCASS